MQSMSALLEKFTKKAAITKEHIDIMAMCCKSAFLIFAAS